VDFGPVPTELLLPKQHIASDFVLQRWRKNLGTLSGGNNLFTFHKLMMISIVDRGAIGSG
jgi:hypothetical protein